MPIVSRIAEFHDTLVEWRHEIHARPETAFEERCTADFVAQRLSAFGIQVHRGLAGTGLVGTLRGSRPGGRAIALRADMDALHIHEKNAVPYASTHPGKMHACGHDGHTTMLLGAARYLAETRNFAGAVHFIFQPAEENAGGSKMIEEGLFERFPVEAVFGMHNWPGIPAGEFGICPGPMMAACDMFELTVRGKGAHAALPHLGIDPMVAAAQIIGALQTIVSRNVPPLQSAVVSVTQIRGGDARNVIPETVILGGTARTFEPEIRDEVEARIRRIAEGVALAVGTSVDLRYERYCPATVNSAAETETAAAVAAEVAGEGNVDREIEPTMGSEDFAFMLQASPGAYIFIGNGAGDGAVGLHNPHYDFNDEILAIGASYWARLVERVLARAA
jgi:amidohydrolase